MVDTPLPIKFLTMPLGWLQGNDPMPPHPQGDGNPPCLLWFPSAKALAVLATADVVVRRDLMDPARMELVKGAAQVQRLLDGHRPAAPLNGLIVELDFGTQEVEWLIAAVRHADDPNRTGKLLPPAARNFNSK